MVKALLAGEIRDGDVVRVDGVRALDGSVSGLMVTRGGAARPDEPARETTGSEIETLS